MAPEMVEMLLRRGRELMRIGDVSAARRFFERAAAGGSGQAALEVGATYDPRELQRIGARGIPPDRNAALTWYRRAAAMGAAEAQDRIRALEAKP
jgi:TPR repeat protein